MSSPITQRCIEAYTRHKHLKLAAKDVGIPWQTVYVHLRQAGVPVVGDKSRYGSETDRLAARAERLFLDLVPFAMDLNRKKFQAKLDFLVRGYGVDVKASRLKSSTGGGKADRWSFNLKKQKLLADFFVCFAFEDNEAQHVFLVPGEIARHYTTMSVAKSTRGKWWDYEIRPAELAPFFQSLPKRAQDTIERDAGELGSTGSS